MKTIYLDCGMGAAGDMLSAALYELLDENSRKEFINQINLLGLPNVEIFPETAVKCGITGTHMRVLIKGAKETDITPDHDHSHDHSHEHEHSHDHEHEHTHVHEHFHEHEHTHSSLSEIENIIHGLNIPDTVAENASAVYKLIADAESRMHGVPVSDIHFHEVGTADAIADIVSVCMLINMLGAERIASSPVHVGCGHVRCAHGILPVPAPATAYLLRNIPIYGGSVNGELCTPTGAALLKHFVNEFGEMPLMTVERIGYGMGKKDFDAVNCVRAMIGESNEQKSEKIIELSCNLDDMTPEGIGFASERLFEVGALDVYTVPVGMKKSRPGTLLCVLCTEQQRSQMLNLIFRHTSTLGIRENAMKRYTLSRSIKNISTDFGSVRIKRSEGFNVIKEKYEYEDIAGIAKDKGISLTEAAGLISQSK